MAACYICTEEGDAIIMVETEGMSHHAALCEGFLDVLDTVFCSNLNFLCVEYNFLLFGLSIFLLQIIHEVFRTQTDTILFMIE